MATKKKFKPNAEGVFYAMPDGQYRKAPGLSQSTLKPLAISAAHFKESLDNPAKETAPLVFGRIGHHVLFTPSAEKFWAVKPDGMNLATVEGKLWKQKNYGKTWVDGDTWKRIQGAIAALKKNPDFKTAFAAQVHELSLFKKFSIGKDKLLRKGRVDLVPEGNSLCDVKFVEDAREHALQNQMLDLKWYLQAAYYLDLYNDLFPDDRKTQFVLFVVEKYPPFPVQVYPLDQLAITRGRTEYQDLLKLYLKCNKSNKWPIHSEGSAYHAGPKVLSLPKWANKGVTQKGDFIFG